MIQGSQLIGNQSILPEGGTFTTYNPVLDQNTPYQFSRASTKNITQALQLASDVASTFALSSNITRYALLSTIADEILALGDTLINVYCEETGLLQGRAMGERGRTVNQLLMFAEMAKSNVFRQIKHDEALTDRKPPRSDLKKINIPIGPIVVFGASNFPLAFGVAGGDTASALAVGCPVIVKGHPLHAATGELVARCIQRAVAKVGLDEGVFSYLVSDQYDLGQQLVIAPQIKGVGFTGSHRGGKALMELAGQRIDPIPVFAEMGSINPVIITAESLETQFESLARTLTSSVCLGSGQFCTNPGLIIVEGDTSRVREFALNISDKMSEAGSMVMLHPAMKKAYETGLHSLKNHLLQPYASPHGNATVAGSCGLMDSHEFVKDASLQSEVFGPLTLIVSCKSIDQVLTVISSLHGQLTGSLFTNGNEIDSKISAILLGLSQKVGRIVHNGVPTGVEVCEAMHHGGPYPATSDSRFTSVGHDAVYRWLRPLSLQDFELDRLPFDFSTK